MSWVCRAFAAYMDHCNIYTVYNYRQVIKTVTRVFLCIRKRFTVQYRRSKK